MDRAVTTRVARLLAAGRGGVVETSAGLDGTRLALVASQHGARFAELHGPTSRAALFTSLRTALSLPAYTGANWDAIEEVLAYPEPHVAAASLLVWHESSRLPAREVAIFGAIVLAAAETRAAAGDGPLVLVVGR
jgi:hypothetical protein